MHLWSVAQCELYSIQIFRASFGPVIKLIDDIIVILRYYPQLPKVSIFLQIIHNMQEVSYSPNSFPNSQFGIRNFYEYTNERLKLCT